MMATLNHVALLTASVQSSAEYLKALGHEIGPEEDFPGEGTKEIYVGNVGEERRLLLLMEPTREGERISAVDHRQVYQNLTRHFAVSPESGAP